MSPNRPRKGLLPAKIVSALGGTRTPNLLIRTLMRWRHVIAGRLGAAVWPVRPRPAIFGAVDGQSDGQAANERLTVWRPDQHVVRRAFGAHLRGHRLRRGLQPEASVGCTPDNLIGVFAHRVRAPDLDAYVAPQVP